MKLIGKNQIPPISLNIIQAKTNSVKVVTTIFQAKSSKLNYQSLTNGLTVGLSIAL